MLSKYTQFAIANPAMPAVIVIANPAILNHIFIIISQSDRGDVVPIIGVLNVISADGHTASNTPDLF